MGATKTWLDDQLEVTFRLASGSDEHPTSTNQTFTDDFQKKKVWIDLAYARYSPAAVKGFTLIGGKMKTPWMTNDVFLDTDVNPEGFWAQYTPAKMGVFQPFLGAGYFLLGDSADGYRQRIVPLPGGHEDRHHPGRQVHRGRAVPVLRGLLLQRRRPARGNDSPLTLVPGFRVVGVNNRLEFPLWGRPVTLIGDWAHNCGANDATSKYQGQDNAFATGIDIGKNKKKGDWSLKYRYAFVEANALPGYFVDGDFGYANRRGHVLGGQYNILDSLTAGASVYITQPIFSPTTNSGSSSDENISATLQLDLVWTF